MDSTPTYNLPVWESADNYGMAGAVKLQPAFAQAIESALGSVAALVGTPVVHAATTSSTQWDTLRAGGFHPIPHTGAIPVGDPDGMPGTAMVLDAKNSTGNLQTQVKFSYAHSSNAGVGAMWMRSVIGLTAGTWGQWRRIDPGRGWDQGGDIARRQWLVDAFRNRRGGAIGTAGRSVVALRFDHHLDGFRTKVLPLLQQYDLPWAQALNPGNVGSGDDNATWSEIQSWALTTGGEVWNHGNNHGDAFILDGLDSQIVDSLATLRASLPRLAVEGWIMPGVGGSGYGGLGTGNAVDTWAQTEAGRMILAHHAVATSHRDNIFQPIGGQWPSVMGTHLGLDTSSASNVLNYIAEAVKQAPVGLVLMLHPNFVDAPGGITSAALASIFADLAARRASGELVILSHSGLAAADASSDVRHDLLTPGMADWSAPSGWTRSGSRLSSSGSGSTTVTVPMSWRPAFRGGMREMVVTCRSSTARTITLSSTSGGSVTRSLPAGGFRSLRRWVVIPADAADVTLTIQTNGAVEVADVSLRAA